VEIIMLNFGRVSEETMGPPREVQYEDFILKTLKPAS
jgi:hypothetical protein